MKRLHSTACVAMAFFWVVAGCQISPQARHDKYLARGKALLEQKDYARALLEFKNAARALPKDAESFYEIGIASRSLGDLRTTAASFKEAVVLNPKFANAQLALAQLMAQTNNKDLLQTAETQLESLKESDADGVGRIDALALTELKLGKTETAIQTLEVELAKNPGQLTSSVLLAKARLSQNDSKAAEEILKKARDSSPNSASPHILLGQFYRAQNRQAEAEAEYRKAVAVDSRSGEAILSLAMLEYDEGRKQEAEKDFIRLTHLNGIQYEAVYGRFLFGEGRHEEAVREFQRLVQEHPEDRQVRTRLVAAYQALGRRTDAQQVLDSALKKNPRDLDALLQRGEMALAAGQYQRAGSDLDQVVQLQPNSAEAHYVLAKVNLARHEALNYRNQLSETIKLNPYLLPVRIELAQNLANNKAAGGALDILNAAPQSQKNSLDWIVANNWALWASGDTAEMRKGIDQGLSRERSPDLLIQDGLWKLKTGNPPGARAALEEALEINPADVRALSGLNQSYLAQKQDAVAVQKVEEYASRQPQSAPVQEFLGTMLLVHGDRVRARAAFTAAKSADSHSVAADLSLMQVDVLDHKTEDARKRLQAILSADSDNETATLWLANLETMTGDYHTAMEHYRKVVAANPGNAQALNNLAYLLAEYAHQPTEALKYAQKAQELAPDSAEYRDTLGWVLYHQGLYPLAVMELQRATSKGDNVLWDYHLAMAYTKAGDLTHGRAILQAALKRNPNIPEAKIAQEMLGGAK